MSRASGCVCGQCLKTAWCATNTARRRRLCRHCRPQVVAHYARPPKPRPRCGGRRTTSPPPTRRPRPPPSALPDVGRGFAFWHRCSVATVRRTPGMVHLVRHYRRALVRRQPLPPPRSPTSRRRLMRSAAWWACRRRLWPPAPAARRLAATSRSAGAAPGDFRWRWFNASCHSSAIPAGGWITRRGPHRPRRRLRRRLRQRHHLRRRRHHPEPRIPRHRRRQVSMGVARSLLVGPAAPLTMGRAASTAASLTMLLKGSPYAPPAVSVPPLAPAVSPACAPTRAPAVQPPANPSVLPVVYLAPTPGTAT